MTEAKRALLWARLSVNHTKKTCAAVSAVPILALVFIVALKLFVFNTPTARDYFLKHDPRTRLDNARDAAHAEYPYEKPGDLSRRDNVNTLALLLRSTKQPAKSKPYEASKVDTSRSSTNILTRDGLAFLKAAEDAFIATPGYKRFCFHDQHASDCNGNPVACKLPDSILNHRLLYGRVVNGTVCERRGGAEPVSQKNYNDFMATLINGDRPNPIYATFLGKDFNSSTRSTQIIRSFIPFGTPIPDSETIITTEQKIRAYDEWAAPAVEKVSAMSTRRFHVSMVSEALAKGKFDDLARTDFTFASVALWLVFGVAWLHTSSILLATMTLLQIMLAFPLTYIVYRVVFQVRYFAALQVMTIFLILGIGADDVFVFTDAWKQSTVVLGPRSSLEQRMSWTYRRAGRAMGVTSLTTAAAFFVTATSPIMPIATLGAWAGVLVLAQYALVLTLYPCAIIVWHRYWRLRYWRNWLRVDPGQVDIAHEVPAEIEYPNEEIPCAAAETVMQPAPSPPPSAVLDLPQLPRTSVLPLAGDGPPRHRMNENGKLRRAGSSRVWPTQSFFSKNPKYVGHTKSFFARKKQREDEYRPLEKFFNGPWNSILRALRWPLVIIGAGLVAGSIYCATRLEAPSEPESFLPDGHPTQTGLRLLVEAFPPQQEAPHNVKVTVVWGISGIDRKGTSKYDPEDIGRVELDEKFSLTTADAQRTLEEACVFFRTQKSELLDNRSGVQSGDCWIEDFKRWRLNVRGKEAFVNYPSEIALATEVMDFARWQDPASLVQPYMKYLKTQRIGFRNALTRVAYTEIGFMSRMQIDAPYGKMMEDTRQWDEALKEFSEATKVSAMKRPIAVGGFPWMWQVTQKALVDNMFMGIGVVFAVALVALSVSTGNWIVSLLALSSICGILTNLLAFIWLLGWSLGITESIGVVMAVGFSFDYVAHVATAYVESKAGSRKERTRDALTDLGISVVAGALSTLLAGSMLFVATVTFFFRFGVFIVVTVALSVTWALVFFPALLHAMGPVGTTGDLLAIVSLVFSWGGKAMRKREEPEDTRFDLPTEFCGSGSVMPPSGRSFTGSIAEGSLVDSMVAPRSSNV